MTNLPWDPEAELSCLAEVADPLHGWCWFATEDHFYDPRHRRIFRHVKGESLAVPLSEEDLAYLEDLKRYAFPVTQRLLDSFKDCAERRRKILELNAQILELSR